jgi:hypothetical protein
MEALRPAALMAAHGAIILKMLDASLEQMPGITPLAVAMTTLCSAVGLFTAYGVLRIKQKGQVFEARAADFLIFCSEFSLAVLVGMLLFALFGVDVARLTT